MVGFHQRPDTTSRKISLANSFATWESTYDKNKNYIKNNVNLEVNGFELKIMNCIRIYKLIPTTKHPKDIT